MTASPEPVTDGRLLRGQHTRTIVLRVAVDAGWIEGLGGVTFDSHPGAVRDLLGGAA